MVRFLIPKHTLPTAPSVPTGPFKTHTSTSGISVSSNPFLAHRRGDRLWHASSSYVPPRRRAKNALHYRLIKWKWRGGRLGISALTGIRGVSTLCLDCRMIARKRGERFCLLQPHLGATTAV